MEENTKNMLAGLPYRPDTEELRAISTKAHRLSRDYNQTAASNTPINFLITSPGKPIESKIFPKA